MYPADDDGVPEETNEPLSTKSDSGSPVAKKLEAQPVPVAFPQHRARAASLSVSYTEEDIARAKQFRTRMFSGGASEFLVYVDE